MADRAGPGCQSLCRAFRVAQWAKSAEKAGFLRHLDVLSSAASAVPMASAQIRCHFLTNAAHAVYQPQVILRKRVL